MRGNEKSWRVEVQRAKEMENRDPRYTSNYLIISPIKICILVYQPIMKFSQINANNTKLNLFH